MYLFLQLDCLFHSPEFLNQSIKMNHKGDILRLAADNLSKAVHQVSRHSVIVATMMLLESINGGDYH